MNIVITGASSGVGYEAVLELVKNSENRVLALARSANKLDDLLQFAISLNKDVALKVLSFDTVHGDYEEVLLPLIQQFMGRVDVLINNAGTLINRPFTETTSLDFAEMLQNNYLGHVKMIQHILPLMQSNAHIVNIGSMGGFQGSVKFPGLAAYSSSKAALHVLTECLAAELADRKISVNCLALGSAQTEMLEKAFPGYRSPVDAKEMGKFIADFALSAPGLINGKILPVSVTTP